MPDNKTKVSEIENQCPHFASKNTSRDDDPALDNIMELVVYYHRTCQDCSGTFYDAYLLVYDEDRPDDEMEI